MKSALRVGGAWVLTGAILTGAWITVCEVRRACDRRAATRAAGEVLDDFNVWELELDTKSWIDRLITDMRNGTAET